MSEVVSVLIKWLLCATIGICIGKCFEALKIEENGGLNDE